MDTPRDLTPSAGRSPVPPAVPPGRDAFLVWTRTDQWFIGTTTCALLLVLVITGHWPGYRRCLLDDDRHAPPSLPSYQVELQTATWPALAQIPGIGETLARRIVANCRERELTPQRLTDVKGIGVKKSQLALPYLR